MKINLDRLCKLAGIESDTKMLNEASNRSMHDDPSVSDEADYRFGPGQLSEGDEEAPPMDEEDHMGEMIEVDERMLVQEIRRARKIIDDFRSKKETSKENLQEQQLRKIVSEELENVFKDLNLTSGWVYGKNRPTNSKRGIVNTAFPGVGFKK